MVGAHGEEGLSFEKQVGDVFIDIGYSVDKFTTDSSVIFSFVIQDSEKNEIPFTDVWVRVVRDKSTVFATGINDSPLGGATMVYTFPTSGEYELSARFQKDGKSIAETTFPLLVTQESKESDGEGTIFFVAFGFLSGILVGWLLFRFMRTRNRGEKRST